MSLALYGHPFSAYTQKVLVALYENSTPFEFRSLENPQHGEAWRRRWPLREFPVLVDQERTVAESSIIIEHLELMHPGALALLPGDPHAALHVRFLDRYFDLHVINEVQQAVNGALKGDAAAGLARARDKLELAYSFLEGALAGRAWAAGAAFSMADCAAAPSLFYADWTHPIGPAYPQLAAYRARLLERPSFRRAMEGGRPYRHLFPLGAPERD